MPENVELVMDIETLEIFEVNDLDKVDEEVSQETLSIDKEVKLVSDNRRTNGSQKSVIWEVKEDKVVRTLYPRNKHGSFPYHERCSRMQWGHVYQLSTEEALWKTLEFRPELVNYI